MKLFLGLALCLSVTACSKISDQRLSAKPEEKVQAETAKTVTKERAPAMAEDKELAAAQAGDGWWRNETTDQMDGHKTVIYAIWAKNKITGSAGETIPIVNVECTKRTEPTIFVTTGTSQSRSVRIKFDDGETLSEKWLSTNGAVAPPPFRHLLNSLSNAKIFKIEITPIGQAPQVATFNLANLNELVSRENCKI
jgi:hypothetical protein